jgi:hypothetical protein
MRNLIKNILASAGVSVGRYADDVSIRDMIERLHPVVTDKDLIRLGEDADGGYLVPDDLDGVVACFSPGVGPTASFEEALVKRGIPCFLADASVTSPPTLNKLIHFDHKFLGVVNDDKTTTLDAWVKNYAPAFGDLVLQMDIEGAEWPVLLNVSDETLWRFRIIVIELHDIHRLFERTGSALMAAALERLLRAFHVVHNHPNNFCDPLKKGNVTIPPILELTFLRRDRANPTGYANQFPHTLDRKNSPKRPDFALPPEWYRSDNA